MKEFRLFRLIRQWPVLLSVPLFSGCAAMSDLGMIDPLQEAREQCLAEAKVQNIKVERIDAITKIAADEYEVVMRVKALLFGTRTEECRYDARARHAYIR